MHAPKPTFAQSPHVAPGSAPSAATQDLKHLFPFDVLRVGLAVFRGWPWLIMAGIFAGSGAGMLVLKNFEPQHTSQVQIVRREAPNTFQATELGESFRPREFNSATISAMMRSEALLEKTGLAFQPVIPPKQLQRALTIRREKNTDLISIALTTETSPQQAADLVNQYARNVVEMTSQLQAEEAKELLAFATQQASRVEAELTTARRDLESFAQESGLFNADKEIEAYLRQLGDLDLKIEVARIEAASIEGRLEQVTDELSKQDPTLQRLYLAEEKLSELLLLYTPQHPSVIDQQARVDMLRAECGNVGADVTASFRSTGNTVANQLYIDLLALRGNRERLSFEIEKLVEYRKDRAALLQAIPQKQLQYKTLQGRIRMLEETRHLLEGRRREAQLFAERAIGYYRLFSPATAETVASNSPIKKALAAGLLTAFAVMGSIGAHRALRAVLDRRVVSPSDLRRLTRRPIVATLPLFEGGCDQKRHRWQYLLWQRFNAHLPPPNGGARITGFLSARDGEGKSTWIEHLAQAAHERNEKVMVISNAICGSRNESALPIAEAIEAPDKVLAHLRANDHGALELEVPKDYWSTSTRQQWEEALAIWKTEPKLLVLVELPNALDTESLVLAESLPSVIWICDSGKNRQSDLAELMKTIRESGIALVGTALNRTPAIFNRLPDLARYGLCLTVFGLLTSQPLNAEQAAPSPFPGPTGIDITVDPSTTDLRAPLPFIDSPKVSRLLPQASPKLEAWQERLTLGAGDVLNFQVYGHPQLTRKEVPIGPDGTVTYLQVHDFPAAGLTIDELRDQLTVAIRTHIANARVIITPSAFRSKKYHLLGTVLDRGTYSLDRPMTLLEAAARARGISTGLLSQNTVEIADMRRAFIVRNGHKLNIDFTRLFYEGDLTQNIQLHPGDYIYIPSNVVNEVYVLGAVDSPGQTGVTDSLTALGAITIRGGFSEEAWKRKVLVVRGSLEEKPQVTVLDAQAILNGRQQDMLLEPRDLVYVSPRPWRRAEEVLDIAMRAFVQSATATWTGQNIGPLVDRVLP